MPIREPGVIVNISGEELPPPIPPTIYGLGFYVLAKKGPFKPNYFHTGNFLKKYTGVHSAVDRDVTFLLPKTGAYGMLLPTLGIYATPGIFVIDSGSTNNAGVSQGVLLDINNKIANDYKEITWLPTWLNGPPKRIGVYDSITIIYSSNANGFSSLTRIELNGERYYLMHDGIDIGVPPARFDPANDSTKNIRAAFYRHGSSGNFLVFVPLDNYGKNIIFYFKVLSSNNNIVTYRVFAYTDDDTYDFNNTALTLAGLDTDNTYLSTTVSTAPNVKLEDFSAVYFYPYKNGTTIEIQDNTNYPSSSPNPYVLNYVDGANTTSYDLSISPLDNGYYGFYQTDSFEIIVNGDPYSFMNNITSPLITFPTGPVGGGLYSDIHFSDRRHEGVVSFRNTIPPAPITTTDFLDDGVINSILSSTNNIANVFQAGQRRFYYFRHITNNYNQFVESNVAAMYEEWLNGWHSALLYSQNDVVPFSEAPLEVDFLTDHSANISLGFTLFIRKHNKFLFKVVGAPNVIGFRLSDRYNAVNQYFRLFDLQGFHYLRVQGHSTTYLTPSAIYLNAVLDYNYSPIFGINATLALTDVDHEFRLTQREDLLEINVNTAVRDRVLSLWYFNNNLTEEPRRDDSPLGEENNARTAIRLTKLLGAFVERYIGEPNTAVTRERVTNEITAFVKNFIVEFKPSIADFKVICDETNNPPAVVANNELVIRVEVKFARSIKYIVVFERVLMAQ